MIRPSYVSFEVSPSVRDQMRAHPNAIPPIKKSKKDRVVTRAQEIYGGGCGGFAKRALMEYLRLPSVGAKSREAWLGATEYRSGDVYVINDGAGAIWVGAQAYDYGQALALANCLIQATNGYVPEVSP